MAFDKETCYICKAEFPDKKSVVRHIKVRHPDHVGNRAWDAYIKLDNTKTIETQSDLVRIAVQQRIVEKEDIKKVEKITEDISKEVAKEVTADKESRQVIDSNIKSKSDDAKDKENKQK